MPVFLVKWKYVRRLYVRERKRIAFEQHFLKAHGDELNFRKKTRFGTNFHFNIPIRVIIKIKYAFILYITIEKSTT